MANNLFSSEDDINSLINKYGSKLGKIMSKNLESENFENFNLYEYDKTLLYNVIISFINN